MSASSFVPVSSRARIVMFVAWVLVIAKCVWVLWAIDRWDVPIAPAWVIAPTLVAALLATVLFVRRPR